MKRITGVLGPVLVLLLGSGSAGSALSAEPGEPAGAAPGTPPAAEAKAAADSPADKAADKPAEPLAPAATPPAEAPPAEGGDDARKAYFLHAEALEAELDHEYPRALDLLRQAHALDAQSPEIRFDLARIAALQGGTPADMRPFFEHPQNDADGKALRAGVEARLAPEQPAPSGRKLVGDLLTGSLRLGASVDTNVPLAAADGIQAGITFNSNAPGKPVAGNRVVTTGLIDFAPLRGLLSVDVAGSFSLGRFTSDRTLNDGAVAPNKSSTLSDYDANTLTLAARLGLDLGLVSLMLQVAGNDVLVGFGDTYMRSVDATALAALGSLSAGYFGVFVDAGARSFAVDNNPPNPNNTPDPNDRSGPYVDGGLAFAIQPARVFALRGRLGVGTERAAGELMRTYLAVASLTAQVNVGPVHASGGVMDEGRLYGDVGPSKLGDLAGARADNRLNPYVRAVVDILDNFGVYAGYSFVKNYSSHDKYVEPRDFRATAQFDNRYTRSFIEAGVEGRL